MLSSLPLLRVELYGFVGNIHVGRGVDEQPLLTSTPTTTL